MSVTLQKKISEGYSLELSQWNDPEVPTHLVSSYGSTSLILIKATYMYTKKKKKQQRIYI